MRILFVSAEMYPFAKTGGLADVSAALPRALANKGVDIRVLVPAYPAALEAAVAKQIVADFGNRLGVGRVRLISARTPDSGLPIWLIDCPAMYHRAGGIYQDADGRDWPDNALRFGLLCRVAALIARGGADIGWTPHLVHANDWHAGLAAAMIMNGEALDNGRRPATLFTIHNMAFQGLFDPHSLAPLGLPAEMFSPEGIEFYGRASYLKAGIRYSDRLTAVSPSYAREILLPEFGFGLEHLLRGRAGVLEGILNGIDHDVWTPWTDANLPRPYERNDLASKAVCKAVVQGELGLDVASEAPLVTFVSRLTWQKMAEFLPAIIPSLIERGAQFALLGEGQLEIEAALSALCERFPGKAAIHIGYDERLEHRLHAAADMLLAPARFEPCGLSQMYAMRYGSIPIVRRTGGLADSVVDTCEATLAAGTATGFHFDATTIDALLGAVDRAVALYRQPLRWRSVQRRAMSEDFGWSRSADRYLALYRQMTGNAVPVQAPERIPAVGCPAETWTAPYKGRATA